jgi:hypothetical protein
MSKFLVVIIAIDCLVLVWLVLMASFAFFMT